MADGAALVTGVSGRYATAVFELAEAAGAIDAVWTDVTALKAALTSSPELAGAITNPSLSRGDLGRAMGALAERLGLSETTRNLLGVMASKRRLSHLPRVIADFETLAAAHRGETTVEVTTAAALTDGQQQTLTAALRTATGKDVHMKVDVDPDLIGGLIVKIGSRMIDASIRSKLAGLSQALKEVR